MYDFATLDPRPTAEAAEANDAVFAAAPGGVYGVEVTIPALAARCALGNLDPQHSGGQNVAACVAALECELPPNGATLVTVRPDADSVLAMAVLVARATGSRINRKIVDAINSADCAPRGPWVRDYSPPKIFSAMNWFAQNAQVELADRVKRLVDLLAGGPDLPAAPPVDFSQLAVDRRNGYVVVNARGHLGRGANGLGYRHAPVVVTVNPEFTLRGGQPHLKYGVARWNAAHPMDWAGMLAELQELEPGWGGSTSICGSPQGVSSTLTLEQVTAVVERHL